MGLYLGTQLITPCALFNAGVDHTLLYLRNGSSTDLSSYHRTVTLSNVTTVANEGRFDGASAFYFNGTDSSILVPNLINGNTNFTVECWVKLQQIKANTIYSHGGTNVTRGTGGGLEAYGDGKWIFHSGAFDIRSGSYTTNTWYHVALVGEGTKVTLYVNGNSVGSSNLSYNFSSSYSERFGANDTVLYGETLKGYMDEIRVSNVARWTSNFTPPDGPYGE